MSETTLTPELIEKLTRPYRSGPKIKLKLVAIRAIATVGWAALLIWCGLYDAPTIVANFTYFILLILTASGLIYSASSLFGLHIANVNAQEPLAKPADIQKLRTLLFGTNSFYYFTGLPLAIIITSMISNMVILAAIGWFFPAVLAFCSSALGAVFILNEKRIAESTLEEMTIEFERGSTTSETSRAIN